MAVLKVHDGEKFVQVPSGTLDAGNVSYSPGNLSDWTGGVDPGDLDDALDQLASKTLTAQSGLTDNAIMRADGTDGEVQDSSVILADDGSLSEVQSITGATGNDLTLTAKSGSAIAFRAFGGAGSDTANGGIAQIDGGQGGITSGDGGDANVFAGLPPTSGKGGSCNITAADAVGTNKAGGNIVCTTGNKTGSGADGTMKLDGVDVTDAAIIDSGTFADARIAESNVTQHEAAIDHDALTNFLAIEHVKPRDGFTYNDVTSRTNDVYELLGDSLMSSTEGFVAAYNGSILAHSISVNITTATADDVTFEVRINNSNQSALELAFLAAGGTGVKTDSVTSSSGTITFSAGDVIQIRANRTIGGTMTWANVMGHVVLEYDS